MLTLLPDPVVPNAVQNALRLSFVTSSRSKPRINGTTPSKRLPHVQPITGKNKLIPSLHHSCRGGGESSSSSTIPSSFPSLAPLGNNRWSRITLVMLMTISGALLRSMCTPMFGTHRQCNPHIFLSWRQSPASPIKDHSAFDL